MIYGSFDKIFSLSFYFQFLQYPEGYRVDNQLFISYLVSPLFIFQLSITGYVYDDYQLPSF